MTTNSKLKDTYLEFLSGTTSILRETASNYNNLTYSTNVLTTNVGLNTTFVISVVEDSNNNLYASGYYNSSTSRTILNLDGSASSMVLPVISVPSNTFSNFIIKWNSAGIAQSWTTFGYTLTSSNLPLRSSNYIPNKLLVSQNDDLYWVGRYYSSSASFSITNFSTSTTTTSSFSISSGITGADCLFVIKYDKDGNAVSYTYLDNNALTTNYIVPLNSYFVNSMLYICGIYTGNINIRNISTNATTIGTLSGSATQQGYIMRYSNDNFQDVSIITGYEPYSMAFNAFNTLDNYIYVGGYSSASNDIYSFGNGNTIGISSTNIPQTYPSLVLELDNSSGSLVSYSGCIDNSITSRVYSILLKENNLYVYGVYASTTPVNIYNNFITSSFTRTTGSFSLLQTTGSTSVYFPYILEYSNTKTIQKYNYIPARIATTVSLPIRIDVVNDYNNNLYITGYYNTSSSNSYSISSFTNTGVFNNALTLPQSSDRNRYIIKYDKYDNIDSFSIATNDTTDTLLDNGPIYISMDNSIICPSYFLNPEAVSNFTSTGTLSYVYTVGSTSGLGGTVITKWNSDGSLNYTTRPLLKSIQEPVDTYDVANKKYVDGSFEYIQNSGSVVSENPNIKTVLCPPELYLSNINSLLYNSTPCGSCMDSLGFLYIIGTFTSFNSLNGSSIYNKDGSPNRNVSTNCTSMYVLKYFKGTLVGQTIITNSSNAFNFTVRPSNILCDSSNYVYVSGAYSSANLVYIYNFSSSSIYNISNGSMPIGENYFTIKWSPDGLFDSCSISNSYIQQTPYNISSKLYPMSLLYNSSLYSAINSNIGIVSNFSNTSSYTGSYGYPYGPSGSGTVGMFSQVGGKLVPSGTVDTGKTTISIYKNTVSIGYQTDNAGIGAVCIFVKQTNGSWTQQGSKLVGTGASGSIGSSVSLYEDTLAVGVSGDNSNTGATLIFTRNGTTWTQQGLKLVGSGTAGDSCLQGTSLSLYKNTIAIGGFGDNSFIGATWIFYRDTSGAWTQQGSKLVGTGAIGSSGQGYSVSLYEDTLAVGGYSDNSSTGAVWIFTRTWSGTSQSWSQLGSKLVGTGASGSANQGISVSLYKDTLAVGGFSDNSNAGAVWIFTRNGTTWSQQGSKLVGTNAIGSARQGIYVSLWEDTLAVGGYNDNSDTGATWIFTRNGTTWTQQTNKIIGSDTTGVTSNQGHSLSLYKNILGIGASSKNSSWIFENNTTGLTKYNSQGSVVAFSPIKDFITTDIATDSSGSVYCAGYLVNGLGPSQATLSVPIYNLNNYNSPFSITQTNAGTSIIKWSNTGTAVGYSYIQNSQNLKLATDTQNNLYCTGQYNSSTTVPIYNIANTVSPFSLPASNVDRTFLIKWNSVGFAQQYTFIGNTAGSVSSSGSVNGLITDKNNNVYLSTNYTEGSTNIPLINLITNNGQTQNAFSTAVLSISGSSFGTWSTTGSLNIGRRAFTMDKLQNGNIFVAGGLTDSNISSATSTCEIYNSSFGYWITTSSLTLARYNLNSTLLQNGNVLIVGGTTGGTTSTNRCEIYNPNLTTTTTTGSLNIARSGFAIQTLNNGQVLVAGGFTSASTPTATCELYNPSTEIWTTTGSMMIPRAQFQSVLLPNGNVLAISGFYDNNLNTNPLSEVYNVSAGTWTTTGSLSLQMTTQGTYAYAITTLQNANVMISGGVSGSTSGSSSYDPVLGFWNSSIPNPTVASLSYANMLTLPNGSVLLAGSNTGTALGTASGSCFLYNPVINTWTTTGSLITGRQNGYSNKSQLILLNNGNPMIVGGFSIPANASLSSCEIYRPLISNNAIIKYNSKGSITGYTTISQGSLYNILPIENSLETNDNNVYYTGCIGALTNVYNINNSSTQNNTSRVSINPITNELVNITPMSSIMTNWNGQNGLVNVEPYTEDFIVGLPEPENPVVKTIIKETDNYNYIGTYNDNTMSLNDKNTYFYNGSNWF